MTEYEKKEQEIDIVEIFYILWNARKFIAAVISASLILGIIYLIISANLYRSKITLYSVSDSNNISPFATMAKELGITTSLAMSPNYNIPDIVKSRMLSEKIVSHLWDIDGYDKKITLADYFDDLKNISRPEDIDTDEEIERWTKIRMQSYSEYLSEKRITVAENKQTNLVTVYVFMEQPKLSMDVANYISLFVTKWVNDIQMRTVNENLVFIKERLDIVNRELENSENELKKFKETNRSILNSPDLQLELSRLQRQVLIKQEVYITLIKQKEISQIESNKSFDVVQILDTAIEKTKPFKPGKIQILAGAVLFPLIFSSIFILLTVYINYLIVRSKKAIPGWLAYLKNKILFRK